MRLLNRRPELRLIQRGDKERMIVALDGPNFSQVVSGSYHHASGTRDVFDRQFESVVAGRVFDHCVGTLV